ncbi:hypothetical protein [Chryseobacterium proteolyticum]|uniref:hypothetical protein n=1 Tax=Chryseobacterium proteolyticum TaxID=118127 RepID=UPI0039837DEE
MENTLENKARFFAQYWGQNVYRIKDGIDEPGKNIINDDLVAFLELKPLSMISDEEAIEVAKIVSPMLFEGNGDDGGHVVDKTEKEWISVIHKRKIISVDIDFDGYVYEYHEDENYLRPIRSSYGTDFLRSKGYALPWNGLSVEKMIEYGWIKIKTS